MRKKTRYTGVYERKTLADIAYDYCFRKEGKLIWKCAGYKSQGMTPKEASILRLSASHQNLKIAYIRNLTD